MAQTRSRSKGSTAGPNQGGTVEVVEEKKRERAITASANKFDPFEEGIFQTRKVWRFELIGDKPVNLILKTSDLRAKNPETGKMENIRYSPTEDSIWVREQGDTVKKEDILFVDGYLDVPNTEENLLIYLFVHPEYNKVYRLEDNEEKAKLGLVDISLMRDALNLVFTSSEEELRVIATALGFPNETLAQCQNALAGYAQQKPKEFMDMFDSPKVQLTALVKTAFKQSVVTSDGNFFKWADGGKIMGHLPGVIPEEYLVMVLSEPSEQHSLIVDEIKRRIK